MRPRRRHRGIPALAAVITILVAGCGNADSGSGSDTSTAKPTKPAVEKDARYGTVVALRDAAVKAGLVCPRWRQTNKVSLAAESGECSGDSVLSTFASQHDLQAQIDTYRSFAEMDKEMGLKTSPLLIGPNWIINDPTSPKMQPVLGGTVEGF